MMSQLDGMDGRMDGRVFGQQIPGGGMGGHGGMPNMGGMPGMGGGYPGMCYFYLFICLSQEGWPIVRVGSSFRRSPVSDILLRLHALD